MICPSLSSGRRILSCTTGTWDAGRLSELSCVRRRCAATSNFRFLCCRRSCSFFPPCAHVSPALAGSTLLPSGPSCAAALSKAAAAPAPISRSSGRHQRDTSASLPSIPIQQRPSRSSLIVFRWEAENTAAGSGTGGGPVRARAWCAAADSSTPCCTTSTSSPSRAPGGGRSSSPATGSVASTRLNSDGRSAPFLITRIRSSCPFSVVMFAGTEQLFACSASSG
mmetsp:Transcript_50484/g.98750  ORF Transcript_50484/g.98750 Transcript_50484/m.98750 type:complete len:224 (-) Transcript_50484:761-1432(-)